MFSVVMLIFALTVYILAGLTVLILADKEKVMHDKLVLRLALSFMLGIGLVSMQMFLYSLLSIQFGFIVIALPWVALFSLLVYYDFNSARMCFPLNSITLSKFNWMEKSVIVFLLFEVLYLYAFSLYSHPTAWDAQHIWFLKAKAFFISGSVDRNFLLDRTYFDSHADYPIMIPLSITWLYTAMEYAGDRVVKVIYPIQYLSLLIVFFYMVRNFTSRLYGFVFMLILSIMPLLQAHSGGYPDKVGILYSGDFTGYADLTLAFCFFAGASFMYLYMKECKSVFLFLSVMFLSMAGWAKNEGIVFMFLGLIVLGFFVYNYDKAKLKYFLLTLIAPFLMGVLWIIYSGYIGVDNESMIALKFYGVEPSIYRIVTVIFSMVSFSLNIQFFGIIGFVFIVFLFVNIKNNIKQPIVFIYGLFFLQMAAYGAAYFFTTKNITFHLATSIDRVLLHLMPLVLFLGAINVYKFFNNNTENDLIGEEQI